MYNEKVMDHFTHPRNVGEISDADGVGEVGNSVCGDIMRISIKVERNRITDIKFKTFGCGAAIATSSMVTELAKGRTLEEARAISNRVVAEALDGLPAIKMHCSNLAADALGQAIDDYQSRNGLEKAERTATLGAKGRKLTSSEDLCSSCCGRIAHLGRELAEGRDPTRETVRGQAAPAESASAAGAGRGQPGRDQVEGGRLAGSPD